MNYISKKILEKELFYDGVMVLKYHIEYPTICNHMAQKFNICNQAIAFELKLKAETELYKEAIELYKYNKENGYPVMVYEIYRNFEVTFNRDNLVSLYFDEYIFSGRSTWKYNKNISNLEFVTRRNNTS